MMNWHYGSNWAGVWLPLFLILLAAASAVVVVTLARRPKSYDESPPASADQARKILDERYARGEIDDVEYRRRRELLTRQ